MIDFSLFQNDEATIYIHGVTKEQLAQFSKDLEEENWNKRSNFQSKNIKFGNISFSFFTEHKEET